MQRGTHGRATSPGRVRHIYNNPPAAYGMVPTHCQTDMNVKNDNRLGPYTVSNPPTQPEGNIHQVTIGGAHVDDANDPRYVLRWLAEVDTKGNP